MDWVVIEGVKPTDGRYELDLAASEPTTREWGWIKRLSGYMPATISDGFEGADPELFSVFAVIALRRAGKIEAREVQAVFDRLADAPFTAAIRLESDQTDQSDDEGDAGPPGRKLELQRDHFWSSWEDEFGPLGDTDPERLWDARIGFFGVAPGEVGELTPSQLLGCTQLFAAIHSSGG